MDGEAVVDNPGPGGMEGGDPGMMGGDMQNPDIADG